MAATKGSNGVAFGGRLTAVGPNPTNGGAAGVRAGHQLRRRGAGLMARRDYDRSEVLRRAAAGDIRCQRAGCQGRGVPSATMRHCPYPGEHPPSHAMDLIRAAILGIVQGLSEFLPISSSGHLILVPALFEWPDQGLSFDVGLHLGTLLALLVYFWRDWLRMIAATLRDLQAKQLRFREHRQESQLFWLIALGTVPAAIAGVLFNSWIEDNVRQPWLVAIMLAVVGLVLLLAERVGRRTRGLGALGVVDAVIIGTAQAMALIPGVSRSGATISAGLFRDFERDSAARFAFLLGTPAFVGAALLKLKDLSGESGREFAQLGIGFACSAIVGFAVIHFLLRYLRTRTLIPFVYYRWAVAALTLVIAAARVA